MNNLVSIVIPSYNREKTIVRAINSVLNQSYSNIEVIVVDDCSTDNTVTQVKSIKDKRIRVVELKKNYGACFARNVGIEKSNGQYIAFQDSDDSWHENKVEVQLDFMKKHNAYVSFCNFNKIDESTKLKQQYPLNIREGVISYDELLEKSLASTQCIMVKKSCVKKIRFDNNLPRLQDWDFILELSKKYSVYHLDKVLVDVFVQSNSISKNPQKGVTALNILKEKNKRVIMSNSMINYNWNIYMGNYILEMHDNPSKYYKEALKIKFSFNIFVKYLLSKIGLLIPIYKMMKKI